MKVMNVSDKAIVTTTQIRSAIREQSERLLREASIWQFDVYGWANENDVDPEYEGHARWQVDPPADFDVFTFRARVGRSGEAPKQIEEWKKLLSIAGMDFEGLMKSARMSMGLFLVDLDGKDGSFLPDGELSDLHRMSALIYLATASERLREFFIAAAFRVPQRRYSHQGPYNGQARTDFPTPFVEARDKLVSASMTLREPIDKLMEFAEKIQILRSARNRLIHQVATTIGLQERRRLKEERDVSDMSVDSFADLKQMIEANADERAREISSTVEQFRERYTLLMRASNEAFIFENEMRPSKVSLS